MPLTKAFAGSGLVIVVVVTVVTVAKKARIEGRSCLKRFRRDGDVEKILSLREYFLSRAWCAPLVATFSTTRRFLKKKLLVVVS